MAIGLARMFGVQLPVNFASPYKLAHRALPDLQRMKLCYSGAVVGTEVGLSLGAIKPEYKLDPGSLEHLRLSPRAFTGPGARLYGLHRVKQFCERVSPTTNWVFRKHIAR